MTQETTPTEIQEGLTFLVHGDTKVGKSWFADTAPGPRLILDAEGGNSSRWTPSKKRTWDPLREQPPPADGSWETCIVNVRNYRTVQQAYAWLDSGQHPFRSVIIDSVSETQQRAIDDLVGVDPMRREDWGTLLRQMSKTIRDFRDLANHPTNPLAAVIFVAMSREHNGKSVPYVQGQLATILPYQVDVLGYLTQIPDPTSGINRRYLMIRSDPSYESGERVGGRLGDWVEIPDHDQTVTRMISKVYATTSSPSTAITTHAPATHAAPATEKG